MFCGFGTEANNTCACDRNWKSANEFTFSESLLLSEQPCTVNRAFLNASYAVLLALCCFALSAHLTLIRKWSQVKRNGRVVFGESCLIIACLIRLADDEADFGTSLAFSFFMCTGNFLVATGGSLMASKYIVYKKRILSRPFKTESKHVGKKRAFLGRFLSAYSRFIATRYVLAGLWICALVGYFLFVALSIAERNFENGKDVDPQTLYRLFLGAIVCQIFLTLYTFFVPVMILTFFLIKAEKIIKEPLALSQEQKDVLIRGNHRLGLARNVASVILMFNFMFCIVPLVNKDLASFWIYGFPMYLIGSVLIMLAIVAAYTSNKLRVSRGPKSRDLKNISGNLNSSRL